MASLWPVSIWPKPASGSKTSIAESACGVMDQIAVVLGDEGYVLPLVCQTCLPQPLVRLPGRAGSLGTRLRRAAPGLGHRVRSGPRGRFHGLQADLRRAEDSRQFGQPRRDSALDRLAMQRLPGQSRAVAYRIVGLKNCRRDLRHEYLRLARARRSLHQGPARGDLSRRACTRYAVEENHRVQLFVELGRGMADDNSREDGASCWAS